MSQWIIIMLMAIVVLAVFFLTVMVIDGNRFHTLEYRVETSKVTREHNFVVFSDLHNKEYGKNNEKQELDSLFKIQLLFFIGIKELLSQY